MSLFWGGYRRYKTLVRMRSIDFRSLAKEQCTGVLAFVVIAIVEYWNC